MKAIGSTVLRCSRTPQLAPCRMMSNSPDRRKAISFLNIRITLGTLNQSGVITSSAATSPMGEIRTNRKLLSEFNGIDTSKSPIQRGGTNRLPTTVAGSQNSPTGKPGSHHGRRPSAHPAHRLQNLERSDPQIGSVMPPENPWERSSAPEVGGSASSFQPPYASLP